MRIRVNGEFLRQRSEKLRGAFRTVFGPGGRSVGSLLASPGGMVLISVLILLAGTGAIWASHARAQREFRTLTERFDRTLGELVAARESWLPSGYDVSEPVLDYGRVSDYVLLFEAALPALEADRQALADGRGIRPWFAGARESRAGVMQRSIGDEEGIARRAYHALRSLDDARYDAGQALGVSREAQDAIAGTITRDDGPAELRGLADRLDSPEQQLELVRNEPIGSTTVPGRDIQVTAIRTALISGLDFRIDQELDELGRSRESLRVAADEVGTVLEEVGDRTVGSSALAAGLEGLGASFGELRASVGPRADEFMAGLEDVDFLFGQLPALQDAQDFGTSLVASRAEVASLSVQLESLDTAVGAFRTSRSAETLTALAERSREVLAFDATLFTSILERVDTARSTEETLDDDAGARANQALSTVIREQAERLGGLLDEAERAYRQAGDAFRMVSGELAAILTRADAHVARTENLRAELRSDLSPLAPQVAGLSERFGEESYSATEPVMIVNLDKATPASLVDGVPSAEAPPPPVEPPERPRPTDEPQQQDTERRCTLAERLEGAEGC